MYTFLSRLFPTRSDLQNPQRIVLIQPCCIGDVILATAVLKALRSAYPTAHITWAIGGWSRPAIENHDLLDDLLDTGDAALPVYSVNDFWRFVRKLRSGKFDLAVSLARSPLMSAAILLSGISRRAGIDSAGRGFGYNIRASIDPNVSRHEAEIYLDVSRALSIDTTDCYANVPVHEADLAHITALLRNQGVFERYFVVNPAGGSNPGMVMDAKRWPPENFAALIERLAEKLDARPVMVAGPKDGALVEAVQNYLKTPAIAFIGGLKFGEIAALARESLIYIGNDTGLTHLAAAAGAKTVMIFGPSDPARYTPYTPNARALWKPTSLQSGGVASGAPSDWNWARDGISLDEAFEVIKEFLNHKGAKNTKE